jgi:hypothetical protein
MPEQDEADQLLDYLARKGLPTDTLSLRVESSDTALPAMGADPLDVVFIDGAHAFPIPTVDWYYAGQRLVRDGLLVIDDINLPALSRGLLPFLNADPRWQEVAGTWKWRAYERRVSGPLLESWEAQDFFAPPPTTAQRLSTLALRAIRKAKLGIGSTRRSA